MSFTIENFHYSILEIGCILTILDAITTVKELTTVKHKIILPNLVFCMVHKFLMKKNIIRVVEK